MKLIGFNYTKINGEKNKDSVENLKVNTNIDISEINEAKNNFFKSKDYLLNIKFTYTLNYSEEFAKIEIGGNILLSVENKLGKEILKKWKDKQMPEEFKTKLFNLIIKKSNIRALDLEDTLNIPLHMPMPKVGVKKKE